MNKPNKKYFASDFHLGLFPEENSRKRERIIVDWLDDIKKDAKSIYLVGDIFDFWWEYKKVIPKGFTRFLGKIAELTDQGIEVYFFTGNHDIWLKDYLARETGIKIIRQPLITNIDGKKFYIAHGDGLGPGELDYKFLKFIFKNPVLQWLYARLHPNFSFKLAHMWTKSSRYSRGFNEELKNEDKEKLIIFARSILKKEHFDYFIFGHRHIPIELKLSDLTTYYNLGDWITNFTYVVFDGEKASLKRYRESIKHPSDL